MFKGFSPAADILLLRFEEELIVTKDKDTLISFKKELIKDFEKYFMECNSILNSNLSRKMKIVFLKRTFIYFKVKIERICLVSECNYKFIEKITSLINNVLVTKQKKSMAELKLVPFLGFSFSSDFIPDEF